MISLDLRDKRPIYEQIAEKLKEQMALGILTENTQLPSVRAFAVDLSINPNTIQRAYAELERQGYIYSIKGKGNFVAQTEHLRDLRIDEVREHILEVLDEARQLGLKDADIIALIRKTAAQTEAVE